MHHCIIGVWHRRDGRAGDTRDGILSGRCSVVFRAVTSATVCGRTFHSERYKRCRVVSYKGPSLSLPRLLPTLYFSRFASGVHPPLLSSSHGHLGEWSYVVKVVARGIDRPVSDTERSRSHFTLGDV